MIAPIFNRTLLFFLYDYYPHKVYCGHANKGDGIEIDLKTNALCLQPKAGPNGFPAFFPAMAALGVKPELVLDSGASNISDYRC